MKSKTTNRTFEESAIPVSLTYVAADAACLACVVAVDKDYSFSCEFCFITDVSQKLCRTPASKQSRHFAFLATPFSHLHSCHVQFFKSDSIAVRVNDFLADTVVDVRNEPSLSPSQFNKVSFSRRSACFLDVSIIKRHENEENKARNIQYQLSSGLVSEIQKENIDWEIKGNCGRNNKRSLQTTRLGTSRSIHTRRPHSYLSVCKANFLSDVHCEGFEREHSIKSSKGISFCKEILESELLCRNCRNSNTANYSEIHSGTGMFSQFPTALKMQCPLAS